MKKLEGQEDTQQLDPRQLEGQDDPHKLEGDDPAHGDMSGALVSLIAWTLGVCLCVLVIVVTVKAVIWVCG